MGRKHLSKNLSHKDLPDLTHIDEHQTLVRQQVLVKAELQRSTLIQRLLQIEAKKVKGVKEQLDKGEIVEKIKASDKFIERLKHGVNSPSKQD